MSGANSASGPNFDPITGSTSPLTVGRNVASLQVGAAVNNLTANPLFATAVAFIRKNFANKAESGLVTPTQAKAAGDLAIKKLQAGNSDFGGGGNSPVTKA